MAEKIRVVHYINQFFAGSGSEEQAGLPPERRDGAVGPGKAFVPVLGGDAEIVTTLVCGDDYFSDQPDEAADALIDLIAADPLDVLIAGPAFNSGRYGMACGKVCQRVQERLGIPAVTGVSPENPAADVYTAYIYVVPTGDTAAKMRDAVPPMAALALKLARGEELATPDADNYFPRGRRRNKFVEDFAAVRAVTMLLKKVRGEVFETELRIPSLDRVPPAPKLQELENARLAVGTEGGTVPMGNPDHIEAVRATHWAQYPFTGEAALQVGTYESAHGGYDSRYANADPNRMVPVDGMRALEKKQVYRELYENFFSTVGCGMPIATGTEIGHAIAQAMKEEGIEGIVLTAT
jgi:glycine reductase|tara:strand:+ start:10375 stop:11427 length:1053 start_codon:yes stop_codon:yes gene_type:complete